MTGISEGIAAMRKRLAGATAAAIAGVRELREKRDSKRAELHAVESAPMPLDEAEAEARAIVAAHGEAWLQKHGTRLLKSHVPRARALAQVGRGDVLLPWSLDEPVPWGAQCVHEPDWAVGFLAGLLRALKATGKYKEGPPAAERPARRARLLSEIEDIERQEERVVDELAADGVVVQHRREVIQRREQEARRRQLEEQKAADQRAREAAIDAEHAANAARPRGGPSPYLEANR